DAALELPGGRIAVYQLLPDPEIDPLRRHPRFGALLAAMDAPASFAAAPPRPGEPTAVSPDPGGRL
ncbi:MAG TPA: hypothetical protein VHM02_03390, partial [Thermoanaerobaculia bacterium]|nr:hypothetical protein [Thermoanaerobaculia bacterium]